ncbi:MAG TPA: hypothetical protein VMJ10_20940, partial [Kofleriaceae bacterium]|nr:hypothetical protein [Kofleriaceae bacterium]
MRFASHWLRRTLAIPTRWLVACMIVVVAVIGALAYWDEQRRAEAQLEDFAAQQASVADAAAIAYAAGARDRLRVLETADQRVVLVAPTGSVYALDDHRIDLPAVIEAASRGDRTLRVDRDDAPALGLPRRTAMVGFARVPNTSWTIAIAATAARPRDRERAGLTRLVLAIALAAGLVGAFGGLALARQRAQHELERSLAIAELSRARDEELERLARAATMAAV